MRQHHDLRRRRAALLALMLCASTLRGESSPPLPSSLYGTLSPASAIPEGTSVTAWINGAQFAEGEAFSADGGMAYNLRVTGDIPQTPQIEGGQNGQAVTLRVGGAPAAEGGSWQSGSHVRLDLTAPEGPDVGIAVDDGLSFITSGERFIYTLTVTNHGPGIAKGIVIRDPVPAHGSLVDLGGGTLEDGVVVWPAFDLPEGATAERFLELRVETGFAVETEFIINTAAVAHDGSQGLDPEVANNTATDRTDLVAPPDFEVGPADLVLSPAQPQAGNTVTVTLTVHNRGIVSGTAVVAFYDGRPGSGRLVGSSQVTVAPGGSQAASTSFVAAPETVVISAVVDPDDEVREASEANNRAERFLVEAPDPAIGRDNFAVTPSEPAAGADVSLRLTVRNGGRLAASNVLVEVFDGAPEDGGTLVHAETIASLPVGGNRTVTTTWRPAEGRHELVAVIDRENAILELSEENNRLTRNVEVRRAAAPDLSVAGLDLSGFTQSQLTLVADGFVRATIANLGSVAAPGTVAVRLFEDRNGDGALSPGETELSRGSLAEAIAAGGSATVSLPLHGTLEFFHPLLWVEVDPEDTVAEVSEANNRATCFGACETSSPHSVLPVREEWFLPGLEIETAPVVAQLTDDNADGRIDGQDIPDIVFHTEDAQGRAVKAVSGLDGAVHWTVRLDNPPIAGRLAHLAAGDLDGDGVSEIVAAAQGKLVALDHQGRLLWVSDPVPGPLASSWAGSIALGDLTADGVPEIAVGRTVLSNTGRLLATGTANAAQNWNYFGPLGSAVAPGLNQNHSIIADLDLDGRAELIAGDAVYRLEGNQLTVVWDKKVPDRLMEDGYSAVGNLDGDPYPEIVYVSSGFVMVLNHDGSTLTPYRRLIPAVPPITSASRITFWGGPPTIADLDRDGSPEILVPGDTFLVAMRANLSTYWRAPIDEVAAHTSSTVFDLAGDGYPEVLFLDQSKFFIFDGRTGAAVYQQDNLSKTACEYPVVADVDNDGQAEILVPSNRSLSGSTATQGLHVLGSAAWRGTRPIWNQHSYHVTNVQLDGTIPSPEAPGWQEVKSYRSNLASPAAPRRLANLTVGAPRVGAATPAGIPVTLRIGNGGRNAVPAGAGIELYAGEPGSSPLAGRGKTARPLLPGGWEDLLIYWQQPGPAGAAGTAVVDLAGEIEECEESDNRLAFVVKESVLPDLEIPPAGVTLPSGPVAGQRVPVSVKLNNLGAAAAAPTVLRIFDGPPGGGLLAAEATVAQLGPGEQATVALEWDTAGLAGHHVLYAQADATEALVERDETNNLNLLEVVLAAPAEPDLAVETLVIAPSATTAGVPVRLAAEISNRGVAVAANVEVSFRVNNAEVARKTLAGPFARDERRLVEHVLDTLALNGHLLIEAKVDPASAEQNRANNSKTGFLDVQGSGLGATVRTDKVGYGSNQNVAVTVTAQNGNAAVRSPILRVTVRDGAGVVIATLNDQAAALNPGASTFSFTWPTAATAAGTYAVVAELIENGSTVLRSTAAFSLSPDRTASAQLFTDRSEYEPDQSVALTGRVRNTGVNASLSNLIARLEVRSPAGAVVFSASQTIPLLSPGSEAAVSGSWPIANAAPGVYSASVDLREQVGISPQLAYAAMQLTVLASSQTGTGLSGELMATPDPVGAGAVLLARFSTRNGGNADIPDLRLRLRLLRLADGEDALVREVPWPLARGESRAGSLGLSTVGLAEGEYQVRLEALLATRSPSLASQEVSVVSGLSIGDVSLAEGDGGTTQATFEVVLSTASPVPVTVDYATTDGTASAGSDYEPVSGTLTFAAGETAKQIGVTVHGDTAPEAGEVFLLNLSNSTAVALGDPQALGIIADEEGCASPDLLANGNAEAGTLDTDLPGWTPSGAWTRRLGDPVALDGEASFAAGGGELVQDVSVARFADLVDNAGQTFLVEGFMQSAGGASPDVARIVVEYRDAANGTVLDSFDSGDVASPGAWRAVADARIAPAGTRWVRVRLQAAGASGGPVFFDRLALRSLGIPVLTAEDAETAEGNSGTTPLRFQTRLSCAGPGGVTVQLATEPGTATAGVDYVAATGGLSFTAGTLAQAVEVAVRGDATDERDETLRLILTGGSDVVVLTPQVAGAILDDDGPVTVSIADVSMTEGDAGTTQAALTVRLSDESGQEVRVGWATANGTAMAGADFVSASGTVVFPPGTTSQTVAVQVKGDLLDEPAESFFVRLSSPFHAAIGDGEGDAQIQDNDEVRIAVNDVRLTEGDSGTASATFTVSLSLPSVFPASVQYATADGTALSPADYTAVSGSLTFAPGTTTQTVTVPVVGELVKEPEEIFFLRLANPANALLDRPEGAGTIVDNDGVLISVADLTVREGAANSTAAFKVTLSKSFNQPISVSYQTVEGTATAGADYQAASGTVTFAAGITTQTIHVTVLPDVLEEPVESFSLRITGPTNGALILKESGTATVIDGDVWTVNSSASDLTIPGCLLVTPDAAWQAGSVWRNSRIDLSRSFDKTFKVFLGNRDGADGLAFALQNVGLQAIGGSGIGLGIHGLNPVVGIEIDTYQNSGEPSFDHMTALEGTSAAFSALSPAVQASATSPDVEDGREHDLRIIWNADSRQLDAHFDGSERLVVDRDLAAQNFQGTSSVIYGFTAATGAQSNLQYFCETELCHGSTASPKISVGDTQIAETATGSVQAIFPVTLSCPSAQPVTVSYSTADGTALAGSDYHAVTGTLTFAPGETSKPAVVQVTGDVADENDETFRLVLSDPQGGEVRYAEGMATIVNDDWSMSLPYTRMAEGNTGGWITTPYFLRLSRPLTVPVSFNWTLASGTATAGADFQAKSGTVTFPAGDTMQEIQIAVFGDTTPEPDETIRVNLSNPSAAFLPSSFTLTLVDDEECLGTNLIRNGGADEPLVNGQIPGWTTVRGSWGIYTASPHQGPHYFWAQGNAVSELIQDVDVAGYASPIAAGRMRVQLEGFMHSWAQENPLDTARILLEFRDASKNQVLASFDTTELETRGDYRRFADIFQVPAGTAWVRIRLISTRYSCCDNNAHFDTLSLRSYGVPAARVEDILIPEGSSGSVNASFPIRLQCAVPYPVRIDYLTADGTARAGSDYQSAFGTLTFAAGEVQKLLAVPILGDTASEGNETFFLNLVSVDAGMLQGVATILDDEVSITIGDVSVVEGNSGIVAANFPVTLSGAIDQTVTVDYGTEANSATAGDDFLPISGTLTFEPRQTSKTLRVDVLGDTTAEPDEKLKMNLLNPVNATIKRTQATATIVTEDLGLTISDASVVEGNSGTVNAIFTVTLGAASSTTVSVAYATRADSATAGTDFTMTSGTLSFAAGQTSRTITVAVKGDLQQETSEAFYVDLSNPANASIVNGEGLGIIGDDDACPSPNLLANPGGENPLVGGEIPGWTEVSGFAWAYSNYQGTYAGANFMFPGAAAAAELRQDVDLTPYAAFIDGGIQRFYFEGYVRSADSPPDPARVVLEYLDANRVVLRAFDSGEITSVDSWRQVADLQRAPEGTRWARVRLIARRISSGNADAYFDGFSLRSLDTPTITFADRQIFEGDTESVTGSFEVRLGCAGERTITVDVSTADGTATAGSDYLPVSSRRLTFDPGTLLQTAEVEVLGDFLNEIREAFFLRLSNPNGVVLLDAEARATIRDADPGSPPVAGSTYVYTLDADFDLGSLVSAHHSAPAGDQLQISREGSTFPFLWVAASARGTIVKIETRTGEILGEYSTNPDNHANSDPSRTTVALDGSVWVGNRNDRSVTHVGLPELNQCVDRNGNGVIDTSAAYGDVLPWPNPASVNSNGGVTTALDECILHYVRVSSPGTRHISLTSDGNLWVSGTGNQIFNLIDGQKGVILRTETGFGCGGYGGLTDRNGIVWSTAGGLLRWDPSVSPPTAASRRCLPLEAYGVAVDSAGYVWVSDFDQDRVWKVSPDGNTILGPYGHGSYRSQGLVVDGRDHVWVTSSVSGSGGTTIGHLKNDGTFVGNVVGVPAGSTGVSVDSQGKIWSANLNASNVARIDPDAGPFGPDGTTRVGAVDLIVEMPEAFPYNYSDMTGFSALRSTVRQGLWTVIQDGGKAGAEWGTVTWNTEPQASLPEGSAIVVEARASDMVPGLGTKSYTVLGNGVPFALDGRYLQVRVTLKASATNQSPILSDLRIEGVRDGELSAGDVTLTEGDAGTAEAVFQLSLARPVAREVRVAYATADGTALAGGDYGAVSGTAVFPAGVTARTVSVAVTGDRVPEPDETFTLRLSAPVRATLVRAAGIGTILDNDPPPVLAALKTAAIEVDESTRGQGNPGDVVRYEITISNTGQGPATGVILEDPIPANTLLVEGSVVISARAAGAAGAAGTVESLSPLRVRIGDLAAGSATAVRFDVRIAAPFPEGVTRISNQGEVRSVEITAPVLTDDPSQPGAADPTVTPVVAGPPVLAALKRDELAGDADGDGVPSPGDRLRYEVTLTNSGPTPATEVVFQDLLPMHTTIVEDSVTASTGTIASQSPVRVAIGDLAPGAAATIRFEVQIANPVPTGVKEISNQGSVSSRELPPVPTDDPDLGGEPNPTVTVIAAAPKLVAEKTAQLAVDADLDQAPSPGDTLAYTVTIRNVGNTTATGVSLTDPVPADTALEGSPTASQGTVSVEAGKVLADLGEIAGGAIATVDFRVKIADPIPARVREISNQGEVTSTELPRVKTDDPTIGGAADPTVTHIAAAPVLVVEKTASLDEDADGDRLVSPGDVLLYRITLKNHGNTAATEVRLSDDIQAGTAYQVGSLQTSQGTIVTEQPIVVAVGEIAADAQVTVGFRVTVDAGFPVTSTEVANQAAVTAHELPQGVPSDDPGTTGSGDPTRTAVFITPDVSIGDVSVGEGAGTAQLTVRLSQPGNREVRVAFVTADGSALAGADFTAGGGALIFASGETEKTATVAITDDVLDEPDETFRVALSSPQGSTLADAEGVVTITDDDEPELSIGDVEVYEGDEGTVDATFLLHLSSAANQTVTVSFATSGVTATSGTDFVSTSGQVSFAPGETDKPVTVKINGDLLLEPGETFQVTLASAVGAAIADAVAVGTILDDEVCLGANLVQNPGAEERPVGGEIPVWREIEGTQWRPKSTPPRPFEGLSSFFSHLTQFGELRQDVDVSAFAGRIDVGLQRFAFSARLRSFDESPPDVGRVVVEYRDALNQVVLEAFDSGDVASIAEWREVADARLAPAGTRWVRIRLLATRFTLETNDSFFDAVSLRPLGTAAVSVNDVKVYEGNSGLRDALFTVSLSCPYAEAVGVSYATADGTAQAPSDYQTRFGSLSFAPGTVSVEVPVPIVGDKVDELRESFFLNLTPAPGAPAILADPQGRGTIWNDDFCQRSPGYWKNHQSLWPAGELQIGGVWYYTSQLLSFLRYSGSDPSSILAHHLVATKLNLERGSDPAWGATPSVLPTVDQADLFLAAHPPGSGPSGADQDLALQLKNGLDAYNNAGCRP